MESTPLIGVLSEQRPTIDSTGKVLETEHIVRTWVATNGRRCYRDELLQDLIDEETRRKRLDKNGGVR